jgi:hypothetical protein
MPSKVSATIPFTGVGAGEVGGIWVGEETVTCPEICDGRAEVSSTEGVTACGIEVSPTKGVSVGHATLTSGTRQESTATKMIVENRKRRFIIISFK